MVHIGTRSAQRLAACPAPFCGVPIALAPPLSALVRVAKHRRRGQMEDETTPFCRNQPQAKKTACLHPVSGRRLHGADGLAAGTGENAPSPTTCPGAFCRGSSASCVRRTHRTPTFLADNERQTHLDQILPTTKTLAIIKKLQLTTTAVWHIAFHQVHVVATRSQAEVPPTMLAVERKRSRIRRTDAQLGDLNSVPTHEIHCVVLKFAPTPAPRISSTR